MNKLENSSEITVSNKIYNLKDVFELLSFQVDSFDNYCKFNKLLNEYINTLFVSRVQDKNNFFQKAFFEGMISLYTKDDKQEKQELINMLREKNKLKCELLLQLLKKGVFDNLFNEYEKIEFHNVLSTNIVAYMDEVFQNWELNMTDQKFEGKNYGGIKDGKIVSYSEFAIQEQIDESNLVVCGNISKYLSKFIELMKSGKTDEKDGLEIEKYYLGSWDDDSKLGLIGSLENYYNEALIQPELEFYLKVPVSDEEKSQIASFANAEYGSTYGMLNTQLYKVEKIISCGDSAFSRVLGRNFPNDPSSKERFGSKIYIVNSSIKEGFNVFKKRVEILLGYTPTGIDEIGNKTIDEVVYHEFGHNLFKVQGFECQLEEYKATAYYFFMLYHKKDSLTPSDIMDILHMQVLDTSKNFPRIKVAQYYKYSLTSRIIYYYMLKSGSLKFENNILHLDSDKEKFDEFLKSIYDSMNFLNEIYKSQDKEKEKNFIKQIEDSTQNDMEIINSLVDGI